MTRSPHAGRRCSQSPVRRPGPVIPRCPMRPGEATAARRRAGPGESRVPQAAGWRPAVVPGQLDDGVRGGAAGLGAVQILTRRRPARPDLRPGPDHRPARRRDRRRGRPAQAHAGHQRGPDGGLGRVRRTGLRSVRPAVAALPAGHGASGATGDQRSGEPHVHAPAGALRPAHRGDRADTLIGRITMLAGPALAGVIAAAFGLRMCYAVDAVSLVASLYATARLPAMRPQPAPAAPSAPPAPGRLRAATEGLRFIRRRPVLVAAFLTALDAMLLGLPVAI